MVQERAKSSKQLHYSQQESEKVRQLHKLLHGHDREWNDTDFLASLSQLQESQVAGGGSGRRRDGDFQTIAANQLDDLSEGRRESQPCADLKNDLRHRFVRFVLEFCGIVCNLDLFGGRVREERRIQLTFLDGFIRLPLLRYVLISESGWWSRLGARRRWSKLVLLLYFGSISHLIYYLYHQYIYDYHKFRLMRVRWLNGTHLEEARARKLTLEREDHLLALIQENEERILAIGGPQMHMSFAVESVYLMFLTTSLVAYLSTQLYFKFRVPFDFYFVRNFLDYPEEQRGQRHFVRDQVRRFIHSSRNHTRALVWFSRKSLGARFYFERYGAQRMGQNNQANGVRQANTMKSARSSSCNTIDGISSAGIQRAPLPIGQPPEPDQVGAAAAVLGQLNTGELDELILPESFSCKQLRLMLDSSDLRPINQTAGWVGHQLRRFAHLWIVCITIACFFDLCVLYLVFVFNNRAHPLSWPDILVSADIVWLLLLCNVATVFLTTVNVFTAIDQAELASKLRQLIELVIHLNELRFHKNLEQRSRVQCVKEARRNTLISLRQQTAETRRQLARLDEVQSELSGGQNNKIYDFSYENAMNKDILLALMHYKTFVASMMPLKRSLHAAAFTVLITMFLFPIISRLHMPYFRLEHTQDARLLSVTLCLLVIIPVDINLIPVCHLHKRCMNLYDQLNRLLAHTTDILNYPEGRGVYDRHIVSILRKELCFPERMAAQFAIKVNGFSLTYPGLVRLHFYFGFILLSIISENQSSQQEVVGTLLQDPFGIF